MHNFFIEKKIGFEKRSMIKHENIFLIFLFLLSLLDMAMEKSPSPKPNICFIREFSLLRILKMQIMATFTAAVPNKDFPAYQQKYLETVVTKKPVFECAGADY